MEEILHHLRLVVYPIIHRDLYISGGAGFLPSTVAPANWWLEYYFVSFWGPGPSFRGELLLSGRVYLWHSITTSSWWWENPCIPHTQLGVKIQKKCWTPPSSHLVKVEWSTKTHISLDSWCFKITPVRDIRSFTGTSETPKLVRFVFWKENSIVTIRATQRWEMVSLSWNSYHETMDPESSQSSKTSNDVSKVSLIHDGSCIWGETKQES